MGALTIQTSQTNTNYHQNPLTLIPKCTSLKELKQIQALAIKTHLQNETSIIHKLIIHCTANPTQASMNHAHQLFDRIPQPDIVLFNILTKGYARSETPLGAVSLFAGTLFGDLRPDNYTFPSLFKACAASNAITEGSQIHCQAIKLGLSGDSYVVPALINMYALAGDFVSARRAFDVSGKRCGVAYNAIILACARNGRPNEALALFREFQMSPNLGPPTEVTLLGILSCCASLGALNLGKWTHEYTSKLSLNSIKLNTALIDMYAKCGSLEDAEAVFEFMSEKDTPAWSAMISAHAIHGKAQRAFSLFHQMQTEKLVPDETTFLGLLSACSHAGLIQRGFQVFEDMTQNYIIKPRIKHFGCLVDLLSRSGRLNQAFVLIDKLPVNSPSQILWRTLLSACSSRGDIDLGRRVMAKIDNPNGGDYVMFSNLCAKSGNRKEVDFWRKAMRDKRVAKIPGCSAVEVDNVVHEFFAGDGERRVSGELQRRLDGLFDEIKEVGYVPEVGLVCHDMSYEEKEMTLKYHSEKLAIAFGLLKTRPGTTIRVVKNLRVCKDCHSAAKFMSSVTKRVIVLRDVQRFHHFKDGECSCGDYW